MKTSVFILMFAFLGFFPEEENIVSHKYQLVVFEGSDWCSNCRRLEKYVLRDSSFVVFLNENEIELLRVDFPQRKKMSKAQEKQNQQLAEQYHFTGSFPELVLVKNDNEQFGKILYTNQTVKEFSSELTAKMKTLK